MNISNFLLELNRRSSSVMSDLRTVLKSDELTFLNLVGFNTSEDYFSYLFTLRTALRKSIPFIINLISSDLCSYYKYYTYKFLTNKV